MREAIEFDPNLETLKTLQLWLEYRGIHVAPEIPRHVLVRVTQKDLECNATPSFSKFLTFNVKDASKSFLRAWLSWYGVAPKSDLEVVQKAEEVQSLVLLGSFSVGKLVELALAGTATEPESEVKVSKKMLQDPKTTSTSVQTKLLLAFALDSFVVLTPILLHLNAKRTKVPVASWQTLSAIATPRLVRFAVERLFPNEIASSATVAAVLGDVTGVLFGNKASSLPIRTLKTVVRKYLQDAPAVVAFLNQVVIPTAAAAVL